MIKYIYGFGFCNEYQILRIKERLNQILFDKINNLLNICHVCFKYFYLYKISLVASQFSL